MCNSRAADDGKEALTLAAYPNDLAIDEPHATHFLCRSIATSYNEIPTPMDARIHVADISVPIATMTVAKKCSSGPTRFLGLACAPEWSRQFL